MFKKKTCQISYKRYQCTACGVVKEIQTNHYGECYPRCQSCGWKRPMEFGQQHICLEKVPDNMIVPEPWKMVRLGDIADVKLIHA